MYATFKVQRTQILMDYASSTGEWMGGEVIELNKFNGDPQELAYMYASLRADTHGHRLETLRRV
jgi:hypothetical protein